jgi:hypothetical protein
MLTHAFAVSSTTLLIRRGRVHRNTSTLIPVLGWLSLLFPVDA